MEFTRVNGIGLWNSWTRNFQTPLQALLDLLDNSFDASISKNDWTRIGKSSNSTKDDEGEDTLEGKIHVSSLRYGESTKGSKKSGIVIMNNSREPIKPLREILEVYRSTKGKESESVGENGVGLKQGCATLSDLSFVISKNKREIELGIIAASLQIEQGIRLPSFKLEYKHKNSREVSELLRAAIRNKIALDEDVMNCVEKFGDGNVDEGLKRLVYQCRKILSREWGSHAFCVILAELKHGTSSTKSQGSNNSDSNSGSQSTNKPENASQSEQKIVSNRAKILLGELRKELPRFYIHVPPQFEFMIDSEPVTFTYWQKLLVELSKFEIKIDPKTKWSSYDKKDDQWKNPKNGYTLKLYLGFDPIRFKDRDQSSACFMFIHSRQSGRLIKYIEDARAELGLFNSGSEYSQGLTVIVDDIEGKLPLNPTKQDIAFGEEEDGEAHKCNLFSWTSACVHFFWNHHAEKFHKSKKVLGDKVAQFQKKAIRRVNSGTDLPMLPLTQLKLTTFHGIVWVKHHTLKIRPFQKHDCTVKRGRGTKFELIPEHSLDSSSEDEFDAPSSPEYVPRKRRRGMSHDDGTVDNDLHPYSEEVRSEMTDSYVSDVYQKTNGFNVKMVDKGLEREESIENHVRDLEEKLRNAKKKRLETRQNLEGKIEETESKIVELKKKIEGMDRMMKAMINQVTAANVA